MSDQTLLTKLSELLAQLKDLDAKLSDPVITSDHTQVTTLSRKRAALQPICTKYQTYLDTLAEIADLKTMLDDDDLDPDLRNIARQEIPTLEEKTQSLLDEIKGQLVTADDLAIDSVILEIRAGVGGDEAAIWAGDLLEMYNRYASTQNWKWDPISFSGCEAGGFKQVIVNVKGPGVWQHFGYEGGTHCVKRVPQTESQGRVHTSTATVAVLPEPEQIEIDLDPNDVEENITTSQGPGGQSVNKVATAVKLRHTPTGIEVSMQDTKSQRQNREKAWQLLRARLYEYYQKQKDAQRAETRSKMIGTGERGERIRTYRYKDNLCVDHRLSRSFNLQEVLTGNISDLISALIELDKARRLAAL